VAGFSEVPDINNYVINGNQYTVSVPSHAFVWDSSHGMQDLNTLSGLDSQIPLASQAVAINNSGQVAGNLQTITYQISGSTAYPVPGPTLAFVWDSSHGMQDLGTLGGTSSQALAINDSGQVVGEAQTASGDYHAFEWDNSHGMQDLGTLGGTQSGAGAINASGQVVGFTKNASGSVHAFVWDSSHGMQDLGTLGGNYSGAKAINDSGQVVGSSSTASGSTHAFVWDSSHGMQDLGTLGGFLIGASAINDSGQVTGTAYIGDYNHPRAFVWDSNHGMQDLGTLGGTFSLAGAINDSGQVSGIAATPGGTSVFLATPRANSPVLSALSSPTITYGTATTTLSGHLAAGSLTPPAGETVSVTYNNGTQNVVLDGNGNFSATFSTVGLQAGYTAPIGYFYAGDSSFGAASGSGTLSVAPAPLTITANNLTVIYGTAVPALTASYSGFVNGDTAANLFERPSLTTLATAVWPPGIYPISVAGASDPNYSISYVGGTLTIIKDGTATTVTSSFNSITAGEPVTFTATVSAADPGAGTPEGGQVIFADTATGTYLGYAQLSGGSASLTVSSLIEDSSPHTIIATYNGHDYRFLPSDNSADPLTIVVTDAQATVAITSTLPTDASNNPTAPVGTLVSFGGIFQDSPAESRALNATDVVSWTVTLNGQPYPLPGSPTMNGPTFSFTPTAIGTYAVSLSAVADPDGGTAAGTQQTVYITNTDVTSLQNVVNTQAYWTNEGTLYENGNFNGGNPQPAVVVLQADPTQISAALSALNAIVQPTIYDNQSDSFAVPVAVTLNLTNNNYTDLNLNLQPGITVIVNGVNGSTTVVGNSPALTITSGNVTVNNVTFTTATNAPTILVTGGNLALRNDVVQESTGYADAAISVTGGSVDLGSTGNPGNNTINVNGSGQLVQGSGSALVSAAGDTFQTNGTSISPLTSTTLTSSANSVFFGQSVTLTASVAALAPNTGTPTGTVSFVDQTSGTTLASVAVSSGVKWTSSSLTPGGHNILAVYSGDSKFITSSSSLVENVSSFSGFLAPLSNNLAFNMNRVIPIKWQFGDSSGKVVTGLSAVVSLQVAPVQSGGVIGTPFNPTASNGIGLRNDGKQYAFNWDTKGVAVGTYQIQLTLADGTVQTKTLQIVTKGGYAALVIDGTSGTATTGGLLAGDINLYVDNTNGDLTADELARIQDAVTAADAVTEPYGVAVVEVTDPTLADVTLNMDTTSSVGGYADGVLGCTRDAGQITIISGWNFYSGSDATQIGSGQYDFQTVVTHELGHALGLGHSTDSTSVMYADLAAGTARRALAVADLNVPDDGDAACGLHAASVSVGAAPGNDALAGGPGVIRLDAGFLLFARLFSGANALYEQPGGKDVLIGGAGDDLLIGGNGRDLLIGGFGSDRLVDNGSVVRTLQTIFDDSAADKMTGSSGQDWFWASIGGSGTHDKITDLSAREFASDLAFIQAE
jgi:probable HAF family extracellular repeat protein